MLVVCACVSEKRGGKLKKKKHLVKIKSAPLNNSLIDRPIRPFIMAQSKVSRRAGREHTRLHDKQCTVSIGGQWCNYSGWIKDTGTSLAHKKSSLSSSCLYLCCPCTVNIQFLLK